MKKLIAMLLAVMMVLSLAACGEKPAEQPAEAPAEEAAPETEAPAEEAEDEEEELSEYDMESSEIYEAQLGEFLKYYKLADEAESVSERYALMAIAEGSLMEAAVLLPGTTRGGNFGMGRLAKRSGSTVAWGNDRDRYHNVIVTTELIKAEDNNHLKDLWNEVRGTGTYTEEAIKYLESKGYEIKDSFARGYSSDPKTWDTLSTSRQADAEPVNYTYDCLVMYDNENVMQPALAESWEASEDGLTYTFHLREGLQWDDAQGRKVADLKADDFVAGMQHMMDAQGGLEYLVGEGNANIVNADAYIAGEITDFAEVGVKALDDYTVEYTLTKPTSYFETMLTYSVFAPMSREYFLSKGGAFGLDEFAAAVDGGEYTYGLSKDDIAYCGPYLVTNHTPENTIVFEANPNYYNPDIVQAKTITWRFNDGKDKTKAYEDTKSGVLDSCGFTAPAVEACKKDGLFDEYATITDTDSTSFVMFLNMNRKAFCNAADSSQAVSAMTDEQKEASKTALSNVHFRRAIGMGLDMAAYNAQVVGEELALMSVRNSYTPGTFVSLTEEVTVEINGEAVTYPAGTFYGKIMQDKIDADGVKIKVWDEAEQTSDGFAGWYNPENAKEELMVAVEELKAAGLEISPENPVYLDLPVFAANEVYANRGNALKQSIEGSLDGYVVVNIVECADADEWYNAGYYTEKGSDANYSLYDVSGWGPDYGDPATYLNTMLPDYAGYMTKCLGIF